MVFPGHSDLTARIPQYKAVEEEPKLHSCQRLIRTRVVIILDKHEAYPERQQRLIKGTSLKSTASCEETIFLTHSTTTTKSIGAILQYRPCSVRWSTFGA